MLYYFDAIALVRDSTTKSKKFGLGTTNTIRPGNRGANAGKLLPSNFLEMRYNIKLTACKVHESYFYKSGITTAKFITLKIIVPVALGDSYVYVNLVKHGE